MDRLAWALALSLVVSSAGAQTLGGQQLGNLQPATLPLGGSDLFYVTQNGVSKSIPASQLPGITTLVPGTTPVTGVSGEVLTDNAGVLGQISTSVTVNGTTCTLGTTCTVTAVASALAVGTPLTGGTSGHILYDNAGVVGELNKTGAGAVVLANGPTLGGVVTLTGNLDGPLTTWTDTQTCTAGGIVWDANFVYVCTATNTVKRAALSTF